MSKVHVTMMDDGIFLLEVGGEGTWLAHHMTLEEAQNLMKDIEANLHDYWVEQHGLD